MKVLHYSRFAKGFGMERAILALCRTAPEKNAVVFREDGPIVAEFARFGIEHLILTDLMKSTSLERRLLELVRSCDLLNIHVWTYFPAAHSFAEILGIPSIVTLHWPDTLPLLNCPVFCVSNEVMRMQLPANRCCKIDIGITVSDFKFRLPVERPTEDFHLIRISRPQKCADYFWKAIDLVLERFPRATLSIAGEMGKSTDRIQFLGWKPDVSALLADSDLLVYPPKPDAGANDLVVMESMANGVPPVVTDVPCVNETVEHLNNGILVPFNDSNAFAASIISLLENAPLRQELAINGRRTVEERFDVKVNALRLEALYEDFLFHQESFAR